MPGATLTDNRKNAAARDGSLRVALDAGLLALPPSGIGSYITGLTGGLAEIGDVQVTRLRPPAPLSWLATRAMRMSWDAGLVELARMVQMPDADLLHIPAFSAPVITRRPLVVTVHDVIPFVLPDYRVSRAMRVYLGLMRHSTRRATIVLTPSHAAAADLARVLGIARDRIRVTPLAPDPALQPAADVATVRRQIAAIFGVHGRYLLSMAGFDRRKNVPLLIRAFARALPHLPADMVLVLAGAPHSDNPRVFPPVEPVIRDEGVAARVLLTGRVTDRERRLLYQAASGYVTPSLHEGFGLTPLEAMACGVPVIAARRTSLPEVVGDAGLLVEPVLDEVAKAIVTLMTDGALHDDLADRGRRRAAGFTWRRTAELTAAAYREAIGRA